MCRCGLLGGILRDAVAVLRNPLCDLQLAVCGSFFELLQNWLRVHSARIECWDLPLVFGVDPQSSWNEWRVAVEHLLQRVAGGHCSGQRVTACADDVGGVLANSVFDGVDDQNSQLVIEFMGRAAVGH